jgi:hypothetical protein
MQVVALFVSIAAVAVFGYKWHKENDIGYAGMMLFVIAFILQFWTIWHPVHWVW